ncbi:MAG: hypothetical protein F6K47_18635 [Symploca sp. SIO2E6]|nr:hypothetical protein [Symploca sp. SIO2E6]
MGIGNWELGIGNWELGIRKLGWGSLGATQPTFANLFFEVKNTNLYLTGLHLFYKQQMTNDQT